jgi:hypothetical protein
MRCLKFAEEPSRQWNDVISLEQPDFRATSEILFASFYYSIDFIQPIPLINATKSTLDKFVKVRLKCSPGHTSRPYKALTQPLNALTRPVRVKLQGNAECKLAWPLKHSSSRESNLRDTPVEIIIYHLHFVTIRSIPLLLRIPAVGADQLPSRWRLNHRNPPHLHRL